VTSERPPVIWARLTGQGRGPARTLDHTTITDAAIAIADQDGLDAVSMRKIAGRMDHSTMSLYRHVGNKDDLVAAIRSAAAETDRVAELAEGLLVLARADSANLALARRPVPSGQLLVDVAQRHRRRAAEEHRRIVVEDAFEGVVTVDAPRLGQALDNLAENALRYGRGDITLRAQRSDAALELRVADRGRGFAPEFLPRAFDRFSRPDDARSGDGSGLGLSIVQAIAHAHGGAVTAENLAGHGAVVTISIPFAASA